MNKYEKALDEACELIASVMDKCPEWCPFQYSDNCKYRECWDGDFWKEYFLEGDGENMNDTKKIIETITCNIDSINRNLEHKIINIKEHTKYLDTEHWTEYYLIHQWCTNAMRALAEKDGLLFALEGLKEEEVVQDD